MDEKKKRGGYGMDFESINEKIIEEILSIEDFENVNEELMEKINENEEYRKLFDELKTVSDLVKSSAPVPEKDGISLHDAVLGRVKNGDSLPKYINVRRSYPIATAASLLVVCALVLFAKSGIAGKFANKSFDAASNESAHEVQDFEYFADTYTAAEGGDTGSNNLQSKETVMFSKKKSENGINIVSFDGKAVDDSLFDTADEYRYSDNSVNDIAETEFFGFAEETQIEAEETPGGENLANDTLSREVALAISRALELGADENAIRYEDILLLGEELYLEWFETICESPDFVNLYNYENFRLFCEDSAN